MKVKLLVACELNRRSYIIDLVTERIQMHNSQHSLTTPIRRLLSTMSSKVSQRLDFLPFVDLQPVYSNDIAHRFFTLPSY